MAVAPGLEESSYIADYNAYLAGHIPGAAFLDWTTDGVDAGAPVRLQLQTDRDTFAGEMEAKGVGTDRPVVVYDGASGLLAARIWWALRYHGHPCPLVLEGGLAKWAGEGRELQLDEPCPLKVYASWDASPRQHLRVSGEDLVAALRQDQPDGTGSSGSSSGSGSGGEPAGGSGRGGSAGAGRPLVIDARGADQYRGTVRRAARGGRVPGAVSLPRGALLRGGGGEQGQGLYRPLREVQELLRGVGVNLEAEASCGDGADGEQRIVVYCNGGVASCSVLLALARCGIEAANYDGSWNEYGNNETWPVEA